MTSNGIKYYIELEFAGRSKRNCENCQGIKYCKNDLQGWQVVLDDNYTIMSKECPYLLQEREIRKQNRIISSSRIPLGLTTKTFQNYKTTEKNSRALAIAKNIAKGESKKGLVLSGGIGTGKTHLAAAIMNERLAEGKETIFCTVPELLLDIRKVIREQQDTTELIETIKASDLLVLDDLGAERFTDWVSEQLFIIVNGRFLEDKMAVITTNYTASQLIVRMKDGNDDIRGKRIVSRLKEFCYWENLGNEDMRNKKENF